MNHTSVVATPTHETMSHLALKVIGPIRIGDLIARGVGASVEVWEVRELVLHVGIIYSEEFFVASPEEDRSARVGFVSEGSGSN